MDKAINAQIYQKLLKVASNKEEYDYLALLTKTKECLELAHKIIGEKPGMGKIDAEMFLDCFKEAYGTTAVRLADACNYRLSTKELTEL